MLSKKLFKRCVDMLYGDRTWAEVNLDAIQSNILNIRKSLADNTKIMAVVKADAYGHGCLETANKLIESGVDYFAVACVDEALLLRRHGVKEPILILGSTAKERYNEVIDNNITQTIFDFESAKMLSEKAENKDIKAKVHIKIDTGMARLGFLYGYDDKDNDATVEDILKIASLKGIDAEGIFTHFALADEPESDFTEKQFADFMDLIAKLEQNGVKFRYRHCCNSAATLEFPHMHLDMVRPGIILYGCYPSDKVKSKFELTPAMQFRTRVTNVKKVAKGSPISYGGTFVTDKEMTVATIPVGYADGFPRTLGENAKVIVKGKIVPVLGRICMDQCMIDVTSVNNINVSDEVTIFGKQGDSSIPVESVAEFSNTINYEILCSVGKRIPRVYLQDGNVATVLNFLE